MRKIGKIQFIRSQKKNAQLVYDGYIYNKKLTQANGHTTWRCSDVSKNRCRAVCTTINNELVHVRRSHDHEPHWSRIANRPLYNEEEEMTETIVEPKESTPTIGHKSNKSYGSDVSMPATRATMSIVTAQATPATLDYKYYIDP